MSNKNIKYYESTSFVHYNYKVCLNASMDFFVLGLI